MRRLIAMLAGMSVLGVAGAAIAGVGGADDRRQVSLGPGTRIVGPPEIDAAAGGGLKDCPDDKSANFDTYSLGSRFGDLPLTDVTRRCEAPQESARSLGAPALRTNVMEYMYGTCAPPIEREGGCAVPISVQNFPACERNLSLYERYPAPDGSVYPHELTRIRGTPAAVFNAGTRIEVYSGDATVVIWGQDAYLVRKAARSLKGNHRGQLVAAEATLPAPAPGATEGRLAC